MAEEELWQEKHDDAKLRKDNIKLDSVLVASCSDDGTLRIWLPILVFNANFLVISVKLNNCDLKVSIYN